MSDKKNALAELARRLDIGSFTCDDIRNAQRIIAELAKADATYEADMVHNNICLLAYDALVKCRAIAEEGAGDGIKSS